MRDGLNIASIEIEERRLRLVTPLVTGAGVLRERAILLFVVHGRDGVTGIGESAPLPWAGTEDLVTSQRALGQARTALVDGATLDLAGAPAAAAAVELALLDLASRRLGLPLGRNLEKSAAEHIGVNALIGGTTAEALVHSAMGALESGFHTLKIKVGVGDLHHDLARVAAVRAATGWTPRLRLDANGAWSVEDALIAVQRLAEQDVEMLEQPVSAGPDDVARLAAVRRGSSIPIAADESATSPERVRALIDGGAIDAVVLKPMRIGGLLPARRCARLAQGAGLSAVITSFLGSAIERTAALHLAAMIDSGNPTPRDHGLATSGWLTNDVAAGPTVFAGRMAVPTGSGLGLTAARSRA